MKKIISVLLALSLVLALAGCAAPAPAAELTKEQVLEKANAALGGLESLHMSAEITMAGSSGDEVADSSTGAEIDINAKDKIYHSVSESSHGGGMETYKDSSSDTEVSYINMGGTWLKMTGYDFQGIGIDFDVDVIANFADYYKIVAENNPEMTTTELNGVNCYMLTSKVDIISYDIIKKLDIDGLLSNYFIRSETEVEAAKSALGAVNVTLYIDSNSFMPVGCVVDMKDLINNAMQLLSDYDDVVVTDCAFNTFISDHNSITVTIPDEVKDSAIG